ncbi:uncharacterized protein LOC119664680 [Teleopsis dalmanni]|uniref:uncharacterized protein LOC119664490 n=1 Tax=Teleopsis dalmanni TaxID=139649 RepID=UPI0018CDB58A|nr:uncharacterized protein LOC119664490 [Teleopsis dalmanni]XP_037930061.1 uncharacterized protein LOC119664680 [Teleopsis dalmanni]
MPTKKRSQSLQSPKGVETLIHNREAVVADILRLKANLLEGNVAKSPSELECRLEILDSYIDKAMQYQSKIFDLDPTDDYRAVLEDICVSTKSLFLQKLKKHRLVSAPAISHHCGRPQSKLPSMRLPKFSGKYCDYKNFISLFESLVHSDETLTDIEKFNHLLSCLSDEALGTVKAFQVTERNYPKALASLRKVYDNNCLIFSDNISKLFDLPVIHKPSAASLRTTIDTVSAIYDSLLSIGDDKNITNAILIHLVMQKVDSVTKSKWEEQLDYNTLPLWSDCEAALNKRFQHLSADETSSTKHKKSVPECDQKPGVKRDKRSFKSSFVCNKLNQSNDPKCVYCMSNIHMITKCTSFAELPVSQRFDAVKAIPACINCLKKGHSVSACKSSRCRVCAGQHHTLLHKYTPIIPHATASSDSDRVFVNHSATKCDQVILATALVTVKSKSGEYRTARALLDSGSQTNFMTEELAQLLQLRREDGCLNLIGIGKINTTVKHKLHATVRSRVNSHEFSADFWVLRTISTYQPNHNISTASWKIPANIELADPYFYKSQRIDLLLGAETFFELLSVGQIKQSPNLPTLQKTLLGWTVSGKYQSNRNVEPHANALTVSQDDDTVVSSLLQKFWELEEIPNSEKTATLIPEHKLCEDKFLSSVQRLPSGRFKVSLPFKSDSRNIGLSFETAKRRFLSLERRLSKDAALHDLYMDFMKEYVNLGHMSLSTRNFSVSPHYFIPHQCVLRPQSTSTKLRVVFDASSRTSTQLSLNDILLVGPTIQEELYTTLLRFRMHKYALTADITKMYRQVLIDEADRDFQLILWRESPNEELKTYQLNTVTYGTSSAPFLATRCLRHLSDLNQSTLPIGSNVIRTDFYVDDLLTGADSFNELETIRRQVTQILETAGFQLAKWFSNHPTYQDDKQLKKSLNITDIDTTKALGIQWHTTKDVFRFQLDDTYLNLRATKRNILSISARLFDPLGLLCPIVVKAKILLQELWLQKLDWDESIPMRLDTAWQAFKNDLKQLNLISIPRYVNLHFNVKCQIHGFADASVRAYGCCLYVRCETSNGFKCELLTAKSKVAPLKTKSLPRLELCAAHLLAKLWNRIRVMFHHNIDEVVFWTDSTITLHWIKTHPSTLSTFVANRVSEIQEWSTNITWRHVQSQHNPADIVSRGCNVTELVSSIWQTGPEYLSQDVAKWPIKIAPIITSDQESLETRKTKAVFIVSEEPSNAILKLVGTQSSYMKLMRIVAYILRFINRARKCQKEISLILSVKELNGAFLKVVEQVQKNAFQDEIYALMKKQLLKPGMQKLTPFLHDTNCGPNKVTLLRVGGRLLNAPISHDSKFPLLMPKNCHFINIYLRHLHLNNCHAGPKALGSILRQKIWLVNAKAACSKTVRSCTHCFRYKPKLLTQIMGNLPTDRVTATRPFLISGVDFCGPMYTTLKIRGRPPVKTYIAVFVCFTSKAVRGTERIARSNLLRQRNKFRGSLPRAERTATNVQSTERPAGVICCTRGNRVCLHTASRTTFRRIVGSRRKVRETSITSNSGQRNANQRGTANIGNSGGSRSQFKTNRTSQPRSKRRSSTNTSTSTNRGFSAHAAARINARRAKQQSELCAEMAAAMRAQTQILAGLVQGLYPQLANKNQMDLGTAERSSRPSRRCPRRQSSPSPMVDRQGPRYGSRERRQGTSGRR